MTNSAATPDVGNLLYTSDEDDLRAAIRALLEKQAPWTDVLARTESAETSDKNLWRILTQDIGCAGLAVPENLGGAGATWREAAVVAEELGRAVAPVPFLGSAGIAVALLLELGAHDLVGRMASGKTTGSVVVPFATPPGPVEISAQFRDGRLHGTVRGVADAMMADVLLIPVGPALFAVGAQAEGLTRTEIVSLDMTRPLTDVVFDGVEATMLAEGVEVSDAVGAALRIGSLLLASEQLGVAERCLEMTVEHLTVRRQFGRILGSYQAIKHRLADLWVRVSQARAVARYAAECAATGSQDLPIAVALAKAHCSVVAQHAAEECVQLHGGMGFTWEHPAHLYLKRAKSSAIALGTPERHRAELAILADLPGLDGSENS